MAPATDPFDRHARRLVDVFARRLRDDPTTDPTILATELVAILRGHGWRPIEALQPPTPDAGDGSGREEYLARKAELVNRGAEVGE